MSHYKPRPRYRSDDASRYCHALYAALDPWICDAIGGRKRHRIASESSPSIDRAADSLLADCAQVLAASVEWDGGLLATGLAARGWPVDVELVRLCHTWSTALMDTVMQAHRESQRETPRALTRAAPSVGLFGSLTRASRRRNRPAYYRDE